MATYTCQTARWVSTSPYVKLTVEATDNANQTTTLAYTLQYISDYGAASSSAAKGYSVSIGGEVVKSGTVTIGGATNKQICTGTKTITKTKAAQTIACSCSFNFYLTWSGNYCTSKSASVNATVFAKSKYAVFYNANGGSGAPSTQYKWYGESLALSSTKPTRTGYAFQGWGTSDADTTVDYQSGASYTTNAAITLYAIWKANTCTITYNANGGTGAPAAQTKTYGVNLTLSTTKPTRTNYTFKGWAITATGTVLYQPGVTYTGNTSMTLYAVWELTYVLPKIYNVSVEEEDPNDRTTDANGVVKNYIVVSFNCETTYEDPSYIIAFYDESGEVTGARASGTLAADFSADKIDVLSKTALNIDKTYTIKITVTDTGGETTVTTTLAGNIYPIDVLAGGKGISFGAPASLENTAHFQWDVRFDKSVCGNVPGMYKLPEIPANADFNDYMTTGCWAVYKNANAETIANIPVARAGRLEVWSATGEGIRAAEWSYLRQRFIPYNNANATWERDIARGEDNVWRYYDWHRTTLTPSASEKIYSKAAITAVMSENVTLGALNTYTKVPMDSYGTLVGDRLMIQNAAVKIGANISHVRISGQTLVKCGTVTGNRHARLQRVRANGTTLNLAWVCLYATANSNTVFSFSPIIEGVEEGDTIQMVYYTPDTADANQRGSSANGWQTYLTVEEF